VIGAPRMSPGFSASHPEFWALRSCGEQKNAKICLPLGITTKSDFVFTHGVIPG
jgi:hypothetical protein